MTQKATWATVQNLLAASPELAKMGYRVTETVNPMRSGQKETALVRHDGRIVQTAPRMALKALLKVLLTEPA